MEAVKAYFDGSTFVPLGPVKAKKNQTAIITILDEDVKDKKHKPHVRFIGALSKESVEEINVALLDTQKVDINEW